MSPDVRTSPASPPDEIRQRVIQVELRTPVNPLGARAKSPSPFRFMTEAGQPFARLHEISVEHELHSAHPAIRLQTPGKVKRRKNGEKASLSRFVHLHFPGNADVEEILRRLRALPEVGHAAEYRGFSAPAKAPMFPADPLLGTTAPKDQPHMDAVTLRENQWYIFRCDIDRAWRLASGMGVVLADVDWGFYLDHEDLENRVERTYNAWDGEKIVTAGATDHGTGVLGLAGAASNAVGIAGVAFGATLWAIQYNTGTGKQLPGNALASAIDWVAQQDSGGKRVVINVEAQTCDPFLGNCEQDTTVAAVIRNAISKGCVVCVAAGNGGRDAGIADDGITPIQPTGSILVGATAFDPGDPDGNPRAISPGKSSNYGNRIVVSAPGDANHDITCRDLTPSDYTNGFGGTSGAAAKVAGAIALMLEVNPKLAHDDVKNILTATGSDLNAVPAMGVFLNAGAAVTAAIQSRTI